MSVFTYSVKPRYTAGSPAQVPVEVAGSVAAEELLAYEQAKQGLQGEEAHDKAMRLGLGFIVVRYHDDLGVRHCYDYLTRAEWTLRINGEHLDVHTLPPRVRAKDGRDEVRPDFLGFVQALRDEANWSATIHQNDTTGQAATDQAALNRLAATVERVGKNLGYI
jgi:hypothetical protein